MAIYRLQATIFSREKRGRSVVAAAAYRAGKKLKDEQQNITFDYARRNKGIIQSVILAPEGAASWARDSGQLWNRVEQEEKRVDAQLAREFVLAVPRDMDAHAQFKLAAEWAGKELVAHGMVAEISLHHPKGNKNPHVHILCTLRKLEGNQFSRKKSREWNDKSWLMRCRESWAMAQNAALAEAGLSDRVDHRSLKDQGIDREPEPKIGVAATAMQRRGAVKDPRNCQRARAVRFWNQTRPVVEAMISYQSHQPWWEKTAQIAARVRDFAANMARGLWQSFVTDRNQQPPGDGHDR